MAICDAVDLENSLKTPFLESTFQVGDFELNAIRELDKFLMQKFNSQIGMHYPPSLAILKKQSSKLSIKTYQAAPPPRVDTYEETKIKYQTPPTPTQETPPSAATRVNAPKN